MYQMKKRSGHRLLAGILLAAVILALYGLGPQSVRGTATISSLENANPYRADIIEIDSMMDFGDLERPKVVFPY